MHIINRNEKIIYENGQRKKSIITDNHGKQYYYRTGYFDTEALARIAAGRPPYVTRVYDFSRYHLVTDYIEGPKLSHSSIVGAHIFSVIAEICDALAAIHSMDITLTDLQSSGIILMPDGNITITGIEKAVYIDNGIVTVPPFGGTDYVSAPELLEALGIDRKTDIYALGYIINEMLYWDPYYRKFLNPIIARCMEPVPIYRYGTADDVKAEVEAIAKQIFPSPGT